MNSSFNTFLPFLAETLGKSAFANSFDRELENLLHPTLPTDTYEDEAHYHFVFEVPGITKEQIQIEIFEGVLHVKAQRSKGSETLNLARKVKLPSNAKPDDVKAKLQDGLLTLSFEKVAKPQPKKIEIE